MSDALVPRSTNFQQQGSVDWVELPGRSVQFSVAVLARLSKAGIDPFTLQVGRAVCTNFSLHPIAQGRISDAILALKKFGSYGDIIWFGFGVKHVVTDLTETGGSHACGSMRSTLNNIRLIIWSACPQRAVRPLQGPSVFLASYPAMEDTCGAVCWHLDLKSLQPCLGWISSSGIRGA